MKKNVVFWLCMLYCVVAFGLFLSAMETESSREAQTFSKENQFVSITRLVSAVAGFDPRFPQSRSQCATPARGCIITGFSPAHFQQRFGAFSASSFPLSYFLLDFLHSIVSIRVFPHFYRQVKTSLFAAVSLCINLIKTS